MSKDREARDRGRTDWGIVRRFVEASQDCIWILSPDGRVDYVNPRAETLLGAATAAGQSLRDLWPEENRFTLDRALKAAAAGQPYRFRTFLHGREQSRAYWETVISAVRGDAGAVAGLLAVARDVTHEVETESFLTSVIQLLPSPLSVKNVADRRFVLVNRAAEELLGVSADEALGRTAEELDNGGAERLRAWEDQVLAAGEMQAFDHEVPTADGEGSRHFAVKLLATHDDLGPRHLITLGDDVTERLAGAEALRAALKAAEQASEAKSAFLANMSHELRTPLNGIVAGADMLARDGLSPRARELAEMIRASGETLERLVSDILDLARIEAGQMAMAPAPFHAGETVRSAAALFRLGAEQKGLAFEVEVAPGLDGMALGDMGRLRQVLANLLSNAVKFTAAGRIRLRAERTTGGLARFIVEDTGEGFTTEAKARIFGRFQQADETFTRRFGGAGLGLAICRELVGLMGGTLDAEGIPGAGATFWFEIPLPPAANGAPGPATDAAPASGLRILLADDHPTNRQVIRLMLGEVADIAAVENGSEAVEAFAASRFDLVLMDMQMPVMDGLAAVREIRRLERAQGLSRTPIVMLTANTGPAHLEASLAAGADRHLAKPISTATLFATLDEVLAEATDPTLEGRDLYPNFGHPAAR